MSKGHAQIVLTALIVVFVIGILDYLVAPFSAVIPESIVRIVSGVLIGVAIALIVGGLRSNNGNGE